MLTFLLMNLLGVLFTSVSMLVIWWTAKKLGNAGIVDIFWSLIVAFIAIAYSIIIPGYGPRKLLAVTMVLIWAIRLSYYIYYRTLRHAGEEPRYQKLREEWGQDANLKMLRFYFMQGLGAVVFALPFLFVSLNQNSGFSAFEWVGVLLWVIALAGESASDLQLDQFKTDPANKGKTCRTGLWNYSRHPNYFSEWLVWVAFFVFALGSPFGWMTVVVPASMYYFLRFVTGVPLAEEQALKSRGEEYERYQAEVNVFFPWFPKK